MQHSALLVVLIVIILIAILLTYWTRCRIENDEYDFIIIGAGPAGLQYGIFLEQHAKAAGYTYLILERGKTPGTFFRVAPWNRQLISVNKIHTGKSASDDFSMRHDWHSLLDAKIRMRDVTLDYFPKADHYVSYLMRCAKPLNVVFNVSVESIEGSSLQIRTKGGTKFLRVRQHIIVAAGYEPIPAPETLLVEAKQFGIPIYTYPNIPKSTVFKDKEVVIYGSGNAGCEVATDISKFTRRTCITGKPPRLSSTTQYSGGVRMRNLAFMDQYLLKSLDIGDLDHDENPTTLVSPIIIERPDAIVFCGGFRVRRFGQSSTTKFPKLDLFWRDVQNPRVFYAGVAMHSTDLGVSSGGFVHGFRYLIRAQWRYIRMAASGTLFSPWPQKRFSDEIHLFRYIRWRIQHSSGLYQMHTVLADILAFQDGHYVVYDEVPITWRQHVLQSSGPHVCISFKYGSETPRPWSFDFLFDSERTNVNLFLHPVFECNGPDGATKALVTDEDVRSEWKRKKFDLQTLNNVLESAIFVNQAQSY